MDNERAQVEMVFGLTGGELNDDPWSPYSISDTFGEARQYVCQYNYDGVPEYLDDEFDDWPIVTYRTMVRDITFGDPPRFVYDESGVWEKVIIMMSSGETECWCDESDKGKDDCEMCEGDGFVYIGDGWAEIVYKLITDHRP